MKKMNRKEKKKKKKQQRWKQSEMEQLCFSISSLQHAQSAVILFFCEMKVR